MAQDRHRGRNIELVVDWNADAALIRPADAPPGTVTSRSCDDALDDLGFDLRLDIDPAGRLVSIEILGALKALPRELLPGAS